MSVVLDTTKYRWFLTIPKKKRLQFHKKKKAPETYQQTHKKTYKETCKEAYQALLLRTSASILGFFIGLFCPTRHCCCGRQLLF
jgi:hypothetical protein